MKEKLKITLIIVAIILGLILLDTIQALLWNNNPILGIETKCMKKEGILVDTYHCENGKKITKIRKNKACNYEDVCPIKEKGKKELEDEIKKYFTQIMEETNKTSSNPYDYIQNTAYQNIIQLGNEAVPILVDLYESGYFTKNGLDATISMIAIEEITGCNIKEKYNLKVEKPEDFYQYWKDYNCSFITKDKEVSFLLKRDSLTSTEATFLLKNNTNNDYFYGPEYLIEKKENNKWQEIATKSGYPLVWNTIAYTLKAHESVEINIDWSLGYGELKSGEYRIQKSVMKQSNKGETESKATYLYAEIHIK